MDLVMKRYRLQVSHVPKGRRRVLWASSRQTVATCQGNCVSK